MEAVIISKEAFETMQKDIQEIKEHLKKVTSPVEHFIDNKAFTKLMGISLKTAQIWRDEGKIGFTQEGKKLYYRMSDIETFLEKYHKKPFVQTNGFYQR